MVSNKTIFISKSHNSYVSYLIAAEETGKSWNFSTEKKKTIQPMYGQHKCIGTKIFN